MYKEDLNKCQEEQIAMTLAHRKELEQVKNFYQTIAFGLTRGGKMVKASMQKTQTAKKVMDEMTALFKYTF